MQNSLPLPSHATQPICAGRFTLHLPAPAEGGPGQQVFNGVRLTWQPLVNPELAPTPVPWRRHVEHLRIELGEGFARTRIVKDYMLAGRHAVFYQYVPTPDSSFTLETWTVYGDQVLVSEVDGGKGDLSPSERYTLGVLDHFVPTQEKQPIGSAFCVDSGAIHLAPDQGEQVNASFGLPQGYELDLRTVVVSVPAEADLIGRIRKAAALSLATPGSHATVTRLGVRSVLGMKGQEYFGHYLKDPSPTEFYEAEFQFGGVKDKGSKPGFTLKMDAHDKPGRKVDALEFVRMWDAVLTALEVRLQD